MAAAKKRLSTDINWGIVIFLLIIFFPLGIIYLFVKLKKDITHMRRNGRILLLIGSGIMLICIYKLFKAYDASLGGRETFVKALIPAFLYLIAALFIFAVGFFLVIRSRRDSKLLQFIHSDHIFNLEDLCVLMPCSLRSLRVRIDRLQSEMRLSNIKIIRKEETADISNDAQNELSQNEISQNGASQNGTFQNESSQKTSSRYSFSEILRNILWITASLFSCYSYFYLLVVWFVLAGIAFILELKSVPRNYRIIYWSSVISAGVSIFMILTVGLFNLREDPLSNQNMVIFKMFLPGIPAAIMQLFAYYWLSSRNSQSIIGLKKAVWP